MGKHVGNSKFMWSSESREAAQDSNILGEWLLGRADPCPSLPAPPGQQADPVCGCPCSLGPGCFEAWGVFTPDGQQGPGTQHTPHAVPPHPLPTGPLLPQPRWDKLRCSNPCTGERIRCCPRIEHSFCSQLGDCSTGEEKHIVTSNRPSALTGSGEKPFSPRQHKALTELLPSAAFLLHPRGAL